jgi:hypothetical protein
MQRSYKGGKRDTLGHVRTRKDTLPCIKPVSIADRGRSVPCGARTPCSGPSGMDMTCGYCGHTADFDEFTRTVIGGDLPKGMFQCPKCQRAWWRKQGRPKVCASGFVMPGDVRLVEVGGRL